MKYTNITTIVSEIHGRFRDNNDKQLELYTHYTIKAIQRINIFNCRAVKTIQFTPDDVNGFKLPDDYVDYCAIGVNMCGQLWNMTYNDDILPTTATRCNIPIRDIMEGCCSGDNPQVALPTDGYNFQGYWNNGIWTAPAFGVGGGFNKAYYKVDEANNRINFRGEIPKNRGILQYLSDGINMCGETIVPIKYEESVRAIGEYQFLLHDDQASLGRVELFKKESDEAVARMENLEFSFNLAEFIDSSRQQLRQTVKR